MIRPIPWRALACGFLLSVTGFLCGRLSYRPSVVLQGQIAPAVCVSADKKDPDILFYEGNDSYLPLRFFPRHRDLLYRLPPEQEMRRGRMDL